MMKSIVAGAVVALSVSAAFAQDITIATGRQGGGYDAAAQTLTQRVAQRGVTATVQNMNGSDEISLALCRNAAQVGYMQIDAFYARSKEGCQLKAVANYGTEVAYLLFPPRSPIDELDEMSESDVILVDTVGSGSELFVRTIQKIETEEGGGDDWSKASLNTDGLDIAPAAGEMGDVQAVIMVRKPSSPDMVRLLDLGWTLGWMKDRHIDNLEFNGKPLYEAVKVEFRDSSNKRHKGHGYQLSSFVVTNKELTSNKDLFGKIVAAASN